MAARILWTIREAGDMTADLWQQFREKATREGQSPTGVLARLIRQYVEG